MFLVSAALLAVLAPAPLQLPELLDAVASHAPVVEVSEATLAVTQASVGVAGAWEDATFSVMSEAIPLPGGSSEDPIMLSYQFGQPLNLFGRRQAAKRGARARVERDRAALRRVQWDARAAAAGLFYELWMNGQMDRVITDQIEVLQRMRDTGLARVSAGLDMGHHDVLRAESQIAVMEAERASLADERVAMVAMLNTLRGHDPRDPLGEPVLPALEDLPALERTAENAGRAPEVDAARAMRVEAEANLFLARRMYLPMVMVDALYQQNLDGMPDGLGFGVTVSVPLWWRDRQTNEVAMAQAMTRAADRERDAMQTMANAELRMAWSRARAAERKVSALEGAAIPKLRETIASIEAAYVSGTGDFLSLLDAVMQLQDLQVGGPGWEGGRGGGVVGLAAHAGARGWPGGASRKWGPWRWSSVAKASPAGPASTPTTTRSPLLVAMPWAAPTADRAAATAPMWRCQQATPRSRSRSIVSSASGCGLRRSRRRHWPGPCGRRRSSRPTSSVRRTSTRA